MPTTVTIESFVDLEPGKFYLALFRDEDDPTWTAEICIGDAQPSTEVPEDIAGRNLDLCEILAGPFDCKCNEAMAEQNEAGEYIGCEKCNCDESEEIDNWEPKVSAQPTYREGDCVKWIPQGPLCIKSFPPGVTQPYTEWQASLVPDNVKTTIYKRNSNSPGQAAGGESPNDQLWTPPCVFAGSTPTLWEMVEDCGPTTTTTTTTTSDCQTCDDFWENDTCKIARKGFPQEETGYCKLKYSGARFRIISCETESYPSWTENGWADISFGLLSQDFGGPPAPGTKNGGIDWGAYDSPTGNVFNFGYRSARLPSTTDEEWANFKGEEACGSECFYVKAMELTSNAAPQKTILCYSVLPPGTGIKRGNRTRRTMGSGQDGCNTCTSITTTTTEDPCPTCGYWLNAKICNKGGGGFHRSKAWVNVDCNGSAAGAWAPTPDGGGITLKEESFCSWQVDSDGNRYCGDEILSHLKTGTFLKGSFSGLTGVAGATEDGKCDPDSTKDYCFVIYDISKNEPDTSYERWTLHSIHVNTDKFDGEVHEVGEEYSFGETGVDDEKNCECASCAECTTAYFAGLTDANNRGFDANSDTRFEPSCDDIMDAENLARLAVDDPSQFPAGGIWKLIRRGLKVTPHSALDPDMTKGMKFEITGKRYNKGECVIVGASSGGKNYYRLYECINDLTEQTDIDKSPTLRPKDFKLCKECSQDAPPTTTCDPDLLLKDCTNSCTTCSETITTGTGAGAQTISTGVIRHYNDPLAPPICPGQCITRIDHLNQYTPGGLEHRYVYSGGAGVSNPPSIPRSIIVPKPTPVHQLSNKGNRVWEWCGPCPTTTTTSTTTTTTTQAPCGGCIGDPGVTVWNKRGKWTAGVGGAPPTYAMYAKDDCVIYPIAVGATPMVNGQLVKNCRVYRANNTVPVCPSYNVEPPGSQFWKLQKTQPGDDEVLCDLCLMCDCVSDAITPVWDPTLTPANYPNLVPGDCVKRNNVVYYLKRHECAILNDYPQGYLPPPDRTRLESSVYWEPCMNCSTTTTTTTTADCNPCLNCNDATFALLRATNPTMMNESVPIFIPRNGAGGRTAYTQDTCALDPTQRDGTGAFRLYKCLRTYSSLLATYPKASVNWKACTPAVYCHPLNFCGCGSNRDDNGVVRGAQMSANAIAGQRILGGTCFQHNGKLYLKKSFGQVDGAAMATLIDSGSMQDILELDSDCFDCDAVAGCAPNSHSRYTKRSGGASGRRGTIVAYNAGDTVFSRSSQIVGGKDQIYVYICIKSHGAAVTNAQGQTFAAKSHAPWETGSSEYWKKCSLANNGAGLCATCMCELAAQTPFNDLQRICDLGQSANPVEKASVTYAGRQAGGEIQAGQCVFYRTSSGPTLYYAIEDCDGTSGEGPNAKVNDQRSKFRKCMDCDDVTTSTTTTTTTTTTCCPELASIPVFSHGTKYARGACVLDPTSKGPSFNFGENRLSVSVYRAVPTGQNPFTDGTGFPKDDAEWEEINVGNCPGSPNAGLLGDNCNCAGGGISAGSYVTFDTGVGQITDPSIMPMNTQGAVATAVTWPNKGAIDFPLGSCLTIITELGSEKHVDGTPPGKQNRVIEKYRVFMAMQPMRAVDGWPASGAPLPGSGTSWINKYWRLVGPDSKSNPWHSGGANACKNDTTPTTTTTVDPCIDPKYGVYNNGCNPPVPFPPEGGADLCAAQWINPDTINTELNKPNPAPQWQEKEYLRYGYPKGFCVRYNNRVWISLKGGDIDPTDPTKKYTNKRMPDVRATSAWKFCGHCQTDQ